MTKKLIVPLASIISLIAFIAFSCAPSADAGSEPEEIAGSISYRDITGAVESSITAIPSNNIIPSAATVEYSIVPALPAGLSIVPNTGKIEGTPETESASTSYVVTASGTGNYTGKIDSDPFSISIGPALSNPMDISNSSIRYENITGTVGTDLTISPSKSLPSDAIVTYSIEPTTLPDGLNFNPETGGIAGNPLVKSAPTDNTEYMVTVAATAPYTGSVSSNSFTIVIVGDKNIDGSVLNYPDITGIVGMPLSINPTNNIPSDAKVEYSIDPLILPDGVMFEQSDGSIFGTPRAQATTARYTVRAAGTEGYTGMVISNSFAITISNAQATDISVYSIAYESSTADVGDTVTLTPTLNTIPSDATVTYSINPSFGRLPTGLEFDPDDGGFEGMPTEAGMFDFRVTVTGEGDFTGTVESNLFTIEINGIQITGGTLLYETSAIGVSRFVTLTTPTFTIDPADATVTYSINPSFGRLPTGLNLNPKNGIISGTPSETGRFDLRVTATGTGAYEGIVVSNTFTINVSKILITGRTLSYSNHSSVRGVAISLSPTLTIDQAEATVTYSISSGSLPDWLTLDPENGIISGEETDQVFASTAFQVTATANGNYRGSVQSDPFTIEVTLISIMGTLSYDDFSGVIGISTTTVSLAPTTDTITPAEAVSSFTYAVTSGSLPSELTFDPNNGTIAGTLNAPVNVTLEVTATASGIYEGTVSDEFNIVITEQLMGTISYGGPHTYFSDVGTIINIIPSLNVTPAAARSSLTYAVTSGSLPFNIGIRPPGNINGNALEVGVHTLRITATARGIYGGSVESDEFTITIKGQDERVSISGGGASMTYDGDNEFSFNTGTQRSFAPVLTGANFIAAHAEGKLRFSTIQTIIVGGVEYMVPGTLVDVNIGLDNNGVISIHSHVMTTPSADPPMFTRHTIVAEGVGAYTGTVTQLIRLENLNLQ